MATRFFGVNVGAGQCGIEIVSTGRWQGTVTRVETGKLDPIELATIKRRVHAALKAHPELRAQIEEAAGEWLNEERDAGTNAPVPLGAYEWEDIRQKDILSQATPRLQRAVTEQLRKCVQGYKGYQAALSPAGTVFAAPKDFHVDPDHGTGSRVWRLPAIECDWFKKDGQVFWGSPSEVRSAYSNMSPQQFCRNMLDGILFNEDGISPTRPIPGTKLETHLEVNLLSQGDSGKMLFHGDPDVILRIDDQAGNTCYSVNVGCSSDKSVGWHVIPLDEGVGITRRAGRRASPRPYRGPKPDVGDQAYNLSEADWHSRLKHLIAFYMLLPSGS